MYCSFILQTGRNKGRHCSNKHYQNNYCKRHLKVITIHDKVSHLWFDVPIELITVILKNIEPVHLVFASMVNKIWYKAVKDLYSQGHKSSLDETFAYYLHVARKRSAVEGLLRAHYGRGYGNRVYKLLNPPRTGKWSSDYDYTKRLRRVDLSLIALEEGYLVENTSLRIDADTPPEFLSLYTKNGGKLEPHWYYLFNPNNSARDIRSRQLISILFKQGNHPSHTTLLNYCRNKQCPLRFYILQILTEIDYPKLSSIQKVLEKDTD